MVVPRKPGHLFHQILRPGNIHSEGRHLDLQAVIVFGRHLEFDAFKQGGHAITIQIGA